VIFARPQIGGVGLDGLIARVVRPTCFCSSRPKSAKGKIMSDKNLTGQTVHCLECDDTYPEQTNPVKSCPTCGNTDMMQTVYLQEE